MRSSAASESLQRERAVGISKAPSSPAAATAAPKARYCGERRRPLRGRQRLDRRQQAVAPTAVDEQALLRAVAERALVVDGAAGDAAAHAEFVEQLDHFARVRTRHRQVVGAERAAHSRHGVAAAVAAGAVFELEDVAIVDPGAQQCARRAEAGDAGPDDDRADAPRHRDLGRAAGLRRRPAAAQQVAALGVGADPAAFVARRVVARAGGERRQGGERRGEDVAARRPRASAARSAHRCTLPHSSS